MTAMRFLTLGDWGPGQVRAEWVPGTRIIVPAVEAAIDDAWQNALRRPGIRLFDGPMCRLESWEPRGPHLLLRFSPTSYKPFMGTNLTNPALADTYGPDVLANPLGVSAILETSDGWLMLGRRNAAVAYYPGRLHPFAGCLEPNEPLDVFDEVRRELREELSFRPSDVADVRMVGLVEDASLRQPEAIFLVRSTLRRSEIDAKLGADEHLASWSVRAEAGAVSRTLAGGQAFTPVAVASLLLWGRTTLGEAGEAWFLHEAPAFVVA